VNEERPLADRFSLSLVSLSDKPFTPVGVSTLKPLSYDEFRKAYTQPSMLAVEQEDANYTKRAATSTTGTAARPHRYW
jgi:hypothetical protein